LFCQKKRFESNTALGFHLLEKPESPIFDGQAIELFQVSVASDDEE